jgi:hypothetical protein
LQPDIHVVLEAEMEKSDHLGCPGRVFDLLGNERRDLLDNLSGSSMAANLPPFSG